MSPPRSSSIRHRLQWSVTASVALLYAAGALGVFTYVRIEEEREFFESLKKRLQLFVSETELEYSGKIDASFHDRTVERFEAVEESRLRTGGTKEPPTDAIYYVLRNQEGETLVRSPWLEDDLPLPVGQTRHRDGADFGRATLADGTRLRTAATSFALALEILDPDEEVPENSTVPADYDPDLPENRLHLIVAESDDRMRRMLVVLGLSLAAVGILITIATSLLIALLVKHACRPIEELGLECARIRSDNLDVRLPSDRTPGELAPLVTQFNDLLDRVEQAFERERRFSMDISHELRTPIAELRSLVEVALQPSTEGEPAEDPAEVYRETARIGERINRLIETLSDLYRSGSGSAKPSLEEIDLTDLLFECVRTNRMVGEQASRKVEIESERAIRVRTDPALARGILDNLLGNALTHSIPSTPLVCRITAPSEKGGPRVEIVNETAQLNAEDIRHLGEPFWQKDSARSNSRHFGLGLSSVAAYAAILGIEIAYRLQGRIFTASVTFP